MKITSMENTIEITRNKDIKNIKKHCNQCKERTEQCRQEIEEENIKCDYLYYAYTRCRAII